MGRPTPWEHVGDVVGRLPGQLSEMLSDAGLISERGKVQPSLRLLSGCTPEKSEYVRTVPGVVGVYVGSGVKLGFGELWGDVSAGVHVDGGHGRATVLCRVGQPGASQGVKHPTSFH